MFSGSAKQLNVFLAPPNYDIIRKYNMAAKIAAVLGITLIRFIVIQIYNVGVYSKVFQVSEYTGTTPTTIGWLSHCSIQSKRSSSIKYNTKLYFLSTDILEYIISSTDSLNELVNSNDNHVHTIIV